MNVTHSLSLPEPLGDWDPLASIDADPGIVVAAQRREIRNILKSYTGYYDLFSELIQNALDAVERRITETSPLSYSPKIWIQINIGRPSVSVTDNGCGMGLTQFKQFVRPNFSFKEGQTSRGSKGVGATYLAYGFNFLEVATKLEGKTYSGVLRDGRRWVEDKTETVLRPKFETKAPSHKIFESLDRGTSMTVQLIGQNIRPKELGWIGAANAEQWMYILRSFTPLGGIYLCGEDAPAVEIELEVVSQGSGTSTVKMVSQPYYLYPHEVIARTADLREYLDYQKKMLERSQDISKVPAKFKKLNGIWGEWTGEDVLGSKNNCPIIPRLDENEQKLVRELGINLYIFLAFSTDLWDQLNDSRLGLRKGHRFLRGGLQLATRHMPQGLPLTIPMTNNIGFQNLAHVVVHFENAEPDLGRKGFQPEQVRVAEKLSVSAVTAFRKRFNMLRQPGGAKIFDDELKLSTWIKQQEKHEQEFPLVITGKGLFMPAEELPIRSEPLVEQDVVALFNQMLSSGLIRGVQLIASSQYNQYDGLYRIKMAFPFDKFVLSENNPLGIHQEFFAEHSNDLETAAKILEYKHSVDGLVEEIQAEVKNTDEIGLVIAWEMGEKWKKIFDVVSYLDEDNVHHRQIHGTTHSFFHSVSGSHAFEGIILRDLVSYLQNPANESQLQRIRYSETDIF